MPGFFDDVVKKEFLGRFGGTAHRAQPFYFYFPHLIWRFFPWSALLIALVFLLRRRGKFTAKGVPETVWLICWIAGGLCAMSLISSKRVDRIFPVLPPLCLLLAGLVRRALETETLRYRARQLTMAALLLAIASTTGYTAFKIWRAHQLDRGALVRFAQEVDEEVARNDWRFEIIDRPAERNEKDAKRHEGLLVYLRKLRFFPADEAVTLWRENKIDAVVAPASERLRLMRDLEGAVPATPELANAALGAHYIVLARPRP